jgi:hypothetical protein
MNLGTNLPPLPKSKHLNLLKGNEHCIRDAGWKPSSKLLFVMPPEHSGLDSQKTYAHHTKQLTNCKSSQFLDALRNRSKEDFQNLNNMMGKKGTTQVLNCKKD